MKFIFIMFSLGLVSCAVENTKKETKTNVSRAMLPTNLRDAVVSPYRTESNQKRDIYRHPSDTLEFFGIMPSMTVVEIWASGGWYTEILAPYLSAQGKYIISDPPSDPKGYLKPRTAWMENNPHIAKKVKITNFLPPTHLEIAAPGSVDMVLTFRNVHNWKGEENKLLAFKSFYKALKPGGILGVVDHRAHPTKKLDPASGYLKQSDVVVLAQNAGFKLVDRSEINANPADTRDWPEGVWTLPPRLRLGEKDREKYLTVGESDRMTLKFQKPLK